MNFLLLGYPMYCCLLWARGAKDPEVENAGVFQNFICLCLISRFDLSDKIVIFEIKKE